MPAVCLPPLSELVSRYADGDTLERMAADYGCSRWTVKDRLRKAGVQIRRVGAKPGQMLRRGRMLLDEGSIVAAYNDGISIPTLAKLHQCCQKTIQRRLHEVGAKRGNWRHAVDDGYFGEITTEAQAYWLGMLMADGCIVDQPGRHTVQLLMKDREHVELFARTIGTSAPVRMCTRKSKRDGKVRTYYYVIVSSKQMCADLIRHGVVPRKTCNHGTPALSPELMRHFYRGYVDGDGCLHRKTNGQSSFFVTGHGPFLAELQTWLAAETGEPLETKLQPSGRAMRLGVGGNVRVALICSVLYLDHTVALPRKAALAWSMMD